MSRLRYLIDTNVLLRLANPQSEWNWLCKDAIRLLQSQDCALHYTLQNAAEFWNVSTRPAERNGHGLSPLEAASELSNIEQVMTLLPDDIQVYNNWRRLIADHDVRGVQVHDAKLAAAMLAHNVPNVLTFNTADFSRYSGVAAIHPANLTKIDHAH